jgi:hypothetical protein
MHTCVVMLAQDQLLLVACSRQWAEWAGAFVSAHLRCRTHAMLLTLSPAHVATLSTCRRALQEAHIIRKNDGDSASAALPDRKEPALRDSDAPTSSGLHANEVGVATEVAGQMDPSNVAAIRQARRQKALQAQEQLEARGRESSSDEDSVQSSHDTVILCFTLFTFAPP